MSELYKLPEGWEWINLNKYSNVTSSKRVHKKDYINKGIPFFRSKEIILKSKKIEVSDVLYISEDTYEFYKSKFGVPSSGDILITAVGTLGVTYLVSADDKFYFKDGNLLWIRNISENINRKYLLYYFKSEMFFNNIEEISKGAAQKALTITKLVKLDIPLPPLKEQKRIVSKLDTLFEKIDKAIELHEKNIKEADAFMGSVLNEVFAELEEKYKKITFEEVCTKITDGSHNPPKGVDESKFIMLSSKNIFDNSINFDNPRYLKEEDYIRENKRTDVSVGDVLLTIVGTIGRTAVVNTDKRFTLQRSVAVLKPNVEVLNSYFLMYSLQKNVKFLMDNAKGAAQKGIYLKSVRKLEIVDINLAIQQKTVNYLDKVSQKIEKTKAIQKEKLQNLKDLKASILDQAFKGEL